ncbi:Flp pilus assembly protein TadG [Microbacterium sp. AK009]|uniref:pilus assembly protein TadG-related protein n=1 Tax=Microbacterium sp. AK009 TaxID=2723068 RepID=UPI0015CD03CC|nr:pilus assembly protein TadG-related protein [Microbacterium sp. AK009]NYF17256.1 Flp pilus assembly protein TadG [Microbacterium sp. AK009]
MTRRGRGAPAAPDDTAAPDHTDAPDDTAAPDDTGSVLLLTLGYAILALVVVFVCVDATSLYLAQKRVDAAADAAALAGADGFELVIDDGEPRALLTDDDVGELATALVGQWGGDLRVVAASTPDGTSARVTVAGTWRPPIAALFVPEGVALEATATSRTALR